MIEVKEAVQAAIANLKKLYDGVELFDILLEEVELSEDDQYWNITLGFSIPMTDLTPNPIVEALTKSLEPFHRRPLRRLYKLFKIKADSGVMQSMTMRQT